MSIEHEVKALYAKVKKGRLLEGKSSKGDVSLIFVEKKYIQKLNLKYRKKDIPTDVLTFVLDKDLFEGEIYICLDICEEENPKKWVLDRVIHGLLHLDDCHHDTKEEAKINEDRHRLLLTETFS